MYTVYQIECVTPNHYYVGQTGDFWHRIDRHIRGQGAEWTRKHGVKLVSVIGEADNQPAARQLESARVKEMRSCGIKVGM